MELEAHDTGKDDTSKRPEKTILAPTLGRVVEQVETRSLRQRLVSKFELPKPVKQPEALPVEAAVSVEAKPVATVPTPEVQAVEIPLSDAKAPAEAYIDLRREAVAEELHKAEPQSMAQAEAAADATLLGNASQQLETQAVDQPFTEVIQTAQAQTLEALQYPTEAALQIEAQQAPVEYRADQPLSSFVQSYLEKREQTVRTIAKEQFDKADEPPEFSQAMQLADLLAYSERIFIDGMSLRAMYETKQITEAGLRRITAEYLRGGDVRQALGEEHLRNETKFERDPQLRDQLQASYDNVDAAKPQSSQSGHDALNGLHTAPKSSGDIPLAQSEDTKKQRKHAEHLFAGAWLILIAVLIVIAGILILR